MKYFEEEFQISRTLLKEDGSQVEFVLQPKTQA